MPKTNVNYENTIIYKIEHLVNKELVYVGSTTNFTKRKCQHKNNCINPNYKKYNYKVYKMIRDNGGWESFQMLEIKKFPCKDKREAEAEEERCRIEMRANMNAIKAFCPIELYREEHRDELNDYAKQYRAQHREKNCEYQKHYRTENKDKLNQPFTCECGGRYTHEHKHHHLKSKRHQSYMENLGVPVVP
jgi:hypothetical protein